MKNIAILICIFLLTGCTRYYGNYVFPERKFAEDEKTCEDYAKSGSTSQPVYIPQSTQGGIRPVNAVDQHGNVYTGTYHQGGSPYNDAIDSMNAISGLLAIISGEIREDERKQQCLKSLGWKRIDKKLHEKTVGGKVPKIDFASQCFGADIYAMNYRTTNAVKLPIKIPRSMFISGYAIIPECYQAVFDGELSEKICFDSPDMYRYMYFRWEGNKCIDKNRKENERLEYMHKTARERIPEFYALRYDPERQDEFKDYMSKLKDWASSKSGKTKEKYLKLIKTAFDVDQFCSMIIKCKEETGLYPAKVDLAARALQFVEEGKKKEINKPTDEEL